MRIKFPWSELATIGALYLAAARWSHGGGVHAGGTLALALGLALAWIPRRSVRLEGPTLAGEALLAASAAAALALATFIAAGATSSWFAGARAITLGIAAAGATFAAFRMGRDDRPGAGSLVGSIAVGAIVGVSLAPNVSLPPWVSLAPAALFPVLAFVLAARYELTPSPRTRATFVIPAAASAVAAGLLAVATIARETRPDTSLLMFALSFVTICAGLAAGVGGRGLAWRARVVQAAGALLAGGTVAGLAALFAEDVALAAAGGVLSGTAIAIAAGSGALRVDRGRLLDACAAASEKVTGAERLEDLAASVLDPLRLSTRDLQAPAELWVLPFEARFVLDVSGAAMRSKLSMPAERALLAWLRARPTEIVFIDQLRPLEVRRAEVRPVLAALLERDAFAAVPLADAGELLGVMLVPRGRREALPTLDEQEGLERLARRVSAALGIVMALERARERANEAAVRSQSAESRADAAEQERDGALARLRGVRTVRAVGTLEDAWVGYGEAMRRFESFVRAAAAREVPVAFVTEPGMAIAAVARMLHASSSRANDACIIVDAGEVHPRDALATLVGTLGTSDEDGPSSSAAPGWLELVQGGTLVLVDAPALGSDAHGALIDAMKMGVARRLGGGVPYEVSARVVITARDALMHTGMPADLCERFAESTLHVPPLRERPEDVETLVLFAIDRACRLLGRSAVGIRRDALEALRRHVWPENERELFEALEHAVRVARGAQVTVDDLPEAVREARGPVGDAREADGETYDALERRILQAALERSNGNKSEASRALGLARTTFLDKLRKYGLRG